MNKAITPAMLPLLKGSNVKCIKASFTGGLLVEGKIYTVERVLLRDNQLLKLKGIQNQNFRPARFELVIYTLKLREIMIKEEIGL
jgi:hypothetical protein